MKVRFKRPPCVSRPPASLARAAMKLQPIIAAANLLTRHAREAAANPLNLFQHFRLLCWESRTVHPSAPYASGGIAWMSFAAPFNRTGCSLKEFFPEGIIASGTGVRSGLVWNCFDSSQAHSLGSQISGWSFQNPGLNPH
jgi:hypothetical protein